MNLVIWMLAGAAVGWIAIKFLGYNEQRGTLVAVIIGASGGLTGGKLIAPMFAEPVTAAAAASGDLNSMAVVFAIVVATAFIAAGHFIHERFDV